MSQAPDLTTGSTDVARSAGTTRGARILLVDDRSENLLALDAILSSLEQELVCVRSGEAALDAVVAGEFALILLDVLMPGMDGFETAEKIKQQGRPPDAPIIFLTAAGAEPELAFRAYAAGAVDYISKPFDPWVLRAKVSVYVDLYLKDQCLRALSGLVSAVEAAAAGLAGLPAALTSGELADGLGRLNGTIAALRSSLPEGRPPVPPDARLPPGLIAKGAILSGPPRAGQGGGR